jgi:cysteinyl-tRNA synthetase
MADNQLRQRALGAVLRNALLSWQVAFTVVFTLILYLGVDVSQTIPFWQDWMWLVGGGAAAAAFVIATMTDPQAAQDAITREFERQYDLGRIRSQVARKHVRDALEYRRNMLNLAKQAKGSLRTHLINTVEDINDWIGHMYDLALHIDSFEDNDLVDRDRKLVPQQIEKVRQRIQTERDPNVRADLERQAGQLQQQLDNLNATVNSVKRAEIQLESTLSSLGTIYAQMARLGTKEVDSARAQRMRLEIQDEVASLQDTIEAMDEVQAQSLKLR